MAKRSATSELNHDNWDEKDEKEDPGRFTPLSGTNLQNRVIRKAKRSLNSSSTGSSPLAATSPFAKFSGFSSTANASSFFSTVNKTNNTTDPFLATNSVPADSPATFKSPFNINQDKTNSKVGISSFFSAAKKDAEKNSNGSSLEKVMDTQSEIVPEDAKESNSAAVSSSSMLTQEKQGRNIEYYRQLQSLNESVLKWMQLHLTKNSCCDFTPVFNDYKKHMDSLNVTYPMRKKEATILESKDTGVFKRPSVSPDNHSDSKAQNKFQKEMKHGDDETDYGAHFSSNTTNTSTFSFGIKLTPTATSSNSPAGPASSSKAEAIQNKEENKSTLQFSSGYFSKVYQPSSDKPFSFASAPVEKSEGEGEEYVPPKNDFVAVSEEGALYSKRCKLFFKKGDNFVDKGVGTLHLKALEDKTQLLIRADTNLGNILLNIMLSASLPMSRTGKNNVLIVCIPNPPVDAKNPDSKEAIPILIRVKTSEDADDLLEALNNHKS